MYVLNNKDTVVDGASGVFMCTSVKILFQMWGWWFLVFSLLLFQYKNLTFKVDPCTERVPYL